jgi:hypothetical protein
MSYSAVGKVWDAESFRAHVKKHAASIKGWAKGVTIHHTAAPNLAQRPNGWTIQHMRNLAHFYGKKLRWSAGPHLFTDEDQIFGLSPMTARGVHARSFNPGYLGIEALGNYDVEDPRSGRGRQVWRNTAKAVSILQEELGWTDAQVTFHRDDPRTSKTCPGSKVSREWFLNLVHSAKFSKPEPGDPGVDGQARSENQDPPSPPEEFLALDQEVVSRIRAIRASIDWQVQKLYKLLDAITK